MHWGMKKKKKKKNEKQNNNSFKQQKIKMHGFTITATHVTYDVTLLAYLNISVLFVGLHSFLFIYLFICLFVCLFAFLFIYLFIYLFICLFLLGFNLSLVFSYFLSLCFYLLTLSLFHCNTFPPHFLDLFFNMIKQLISISQNLPTL